MSGCGKVGGFGMKIQRALILVLATLVFGLVSIGPASAQGPNKAAFDALNQGKSLLEARRFQEAISHFDQAIAIDPRMDEAYVYRGTAKNLIDDYEEAVTDFTQAIKLNPKNADAYYNRGIARRNLGDERGAYADFTEAIALNPKHVDAYYNRGNARSEKRDYDGAIADFSRVIELSPDHAAAYYDRGTAKSDNGDYDGAIADFSKTIELRPKDPGAYNGRGIAKRLKGDYEGAIRDHTRAIALRPNSASAYRNRAYARYEMRMWEEALIDFRKAIQLNPHDQDYARFRIWLILARLGKEKEATRELNRYLVQRKTQGAEDWVLHIGRFLLGKISEGKLFEGTKADDKNESKERECEAYFYAGTKRLINGDRETARRYFQRSVQTGIRYFSEYSSALAGLKFLGQ